MIKREHLRQAVDAVRGRDPEAGYTLDEMLAAGRIDTASQNGDAAAAPGFLIDGRRRTVPKILFFQEGAAALEPYLVRAAAEMAARRTLGGASAGADLHRIADQVRREALRRTVAHEIEAAVADAFPPGRPPPDPERIAALREVARQPIPAPLPPAAAAGAQETLRYTGRVEGGHPALFVRFPFCLEALVQVLALNLEFFNLRFVLRRHLEGRLARLFALVVHGRIAGMVFADLLRAPFYRGLEIKYIATRPVGANRGEAPAAIRGTGTCLVAGMWMLWQEHLPRVHEMVLDAEVEAAGFYRRLGFQPRRIQHFALRRPDGPLPAAIAVMADHCRHLHPRVESELARLMRRAERRLARPGGAAARRPAVDFLRACLLAGHQPSLARNAATRLLAAENRIPEARELIAEATREGRLRIREASEQPPLLVVHDRRFQDHLAGVCHMESALRLQAVDQVLAHPDLAGRWTLVPPRPATVEELAWVHTPAHIERIASTAGQPMNSLDLDTQTTADSYRTACLASGGVFELIDAVWHRPGARGFAWVRPPGHHAEPDRAMGFCLFNHAALGACYLQRVYGAERVMIVDIDAHHGNGTQAAFFDSDRVLFVSLHEFPAYPGSGRLSETGTGPGRGYTVNIPMPSGSGDRELAQAMHWIVRPLARVYAPEMILVSCGFDLYRRDRLSAMQATGEGYAWIGRFLADTAAEVCLGRIVFVLEGGYHVESVEVCGLAMLRALCGCNGPERARPQEPGTGAPCAAVRKAVAVHRAWWPSLAGT